jgi:hypothetical protein
LPVPIKVEPQPPVYQYTVPTAPFAVRVVVPPLHIAITPADIDIGFAGGSGDVQLPEYVTFNANPDPVTDTSE